MDCFEELVPVEGEAGSDRVTEATECGEELAFLDPMVLSRSVAMLGCSRRWRLCFK